MTHPRHLKATLEKLGRQQRGTVQALCEHGAYPGGWHLGGHRSTLRRIDSVAKHGLIVETQEPYVTQPNLTHSVYRALPEVRNLYRWEQALKRAEQDRKEAEFKAERERVRYVECSELVEIRQALARIQDRLEKVVDTDPRTPVQLHGRDAEAQLRQAQAHLSRAIEGGRKAAETP